MQLNCYFRSGSCTTGMTNRWARITDSTKTRNRSAIGNFLLAMRITAMIMLIASLSVSAKGVSQNVTFSGRDVSLEKVFDEVKKQTGLKILYTEDVFTAAKPISVEAVNLPVEDFVALVLKNQAVKFIVENRTIFISKKEPPAADLSPRLELESPPITIRGRVVNENGEPVVASIIVKGTQNGTTTNTDGYFELTGVDENATIIITGVSMEAIEVKVNGRTDLRNVGVKTVVKRLEETIIRGYYTEKKLTQVGNVSKITSKDIEKTPVNNPLQAMQGKMAGVQIRQMDGLPGGGFQILIRGANSLRPDARDPLFIIDGVPFTSSTLSNSSISSALSLGTHPLSNININDVESIEVLKDGDATGIYGSRGANGVVLITTKKGKAGQTKVDANVNYRTAKVSKKLQLLNTQEYLQMRREAFVNDGLPVPATGNPLTVANYDLLGWDTTRYTDWQEVLLGGTAETFNAQVNVSGGNSNTQFLFGSGFYRETYVYPGNFSYRKGSGHFNLNHLSDNKRLNIGLTANYTYADNNLPRQDFARQAVTLVPHAPPIYNSAGQLNFSPAFVNPFAQLRNIYKSKTYNLITSSNISYNLLPGLSVKAGLGYNSMEMEEVGADPISALNPNLINRTGSSYFGNGTIKSWIIEPQIQYSGRIKGGSLNVILGSTLQQTKQDGIGFSGSGYTSDALLENYNTAPFKTILSSRFSQYRYDALFGRIGYNWQEKYLFNITMRRDGSSRFGPDKQFGNFGAVGTGWVFSNEKFINNSVSWISYGKLRTSYGITGSDQIPNYEYLSSYSPTPNVYYGGAGLIPSRIANPDYSWETNKKFEAGLELGFCNNRILLNSSWYSNRSSNQLIGYSLSGVTGFSSVQFNLPATVQNTGWEFELTSVNVRTKKLNWTTSFNLTIPRNKLISFPHLESTSYSKRFVIGHSIQVVRTFEYQGIDAATGVIKFKDVNSDGQLTDPDDLAAIINPRDMKLFGGIENTLKFGSFQFDVFFAFANQSAPNEIYSFSPPGVFDLSTARGNQPRIVLERWQKPGDITAISKFTQSGGSLAGMNYQRSYSVNAGNVYTNASYFSLRNLSLAWAFPDKILNVLKLKSGKVYLQGQNLFTITDYMGDPEVRNLIIMPTLRVLSGGIQLTL